MTTGSPPSEASIGELIRQVGTDGVHLAQQEISLAKTELRESMAAALHAIETLGAVVVLALPGVLSLTAALVIGLGVVLHSYWLSALIVGVAISAAAGLLGKRAVSTLKAGIGPRETIRTVREDVAWARAETHRVKQELSA